MAPKSAFRRTIISRSQAARPTLADLRAYDQGAGEEWRVESFGYDRFASLPFDRVAAYLVDGVVTQYSVYVTDAQGGFYVWSENLDRALELQFKEGRPSTFNLRNYAIDLDNLPEAQAAEGSAYRAEILSVDEFRFAAALSGVEFRPDVLYATYDATTGFLDYRTGAGDGAPAHDGTGYASVVTPTLGLVDTLMDQYIPVSRAIAVRLAAQGGLAEYFEGIAYDVVSDKFTPTGNHELAPMFEKILERAPAGSDAQIAWLGKWNDILNVLYADYAPKAEEDLSHEALFQQLAAAYENVSAAGHAPALTLSKAASLLGVDATRIITHDANATTVAGTAGEELRFAAARRSRTRRERNGGRPAGRRPRERKFCELKKASLNWRLTSEGRL
ncbi:hypothetical protein [Methylocystis parvus]|uniref:Uncharacterized protein n=1 Tax=Methylocystis parvus TaxID=134 RepID=A0A6B8M5T2_9HYPH|nr:hypothetical protein [Methylocystis parvus]QGM97482.1 hypothetical protein F7D14_08410 [Methylocystis parvus]WBJ98598.1 hypothetical protein MMG94_11190 [Methylocystis parvus OBBP]